MLGFCVLPFAVPLAIVMATAIAGVHAQYGFSSVRLQAITDAGAQFGPIGYELPLLYIAALVVLALSGATPLSVDGWLAGQRRTR